MDKVICDTGILRRYLGKNELYVNMIDKVGIENVLITPVIRIELQRWLSVYKGLSKAERRLYDKFIKSLPILHLNTNISKIALEISDKDNSLDAPDILIGSTAIYHKIPLYTINKKHFKRMKKGIKVM